VGATISAGGKHITVPVRLPKPLEIKASLDFPIAVCSLATCGRETCNPEAWSQGYRHRPRTIKFASGGVEVHQISVSLLLRMNSNF